MNRFVTQLTQHIVGVAADILASSLCLLVAISFAIPCSGSVAAQPPGIDRFRSEVQPILAQYCYDCHGDGARKGGVAFDELTSEASLLQNPEFWWKVLKNVRAGIM